MATLIDKTTDKRRTVSPELAAAFSFTKDSTAQTPIQQIEWQDVPVPDRIIVRTLDMVQGPAGPIGFVQPDQGHPCNSLDDVAEMIRDIRTGDYNSRPDSPLYYRPLDLNLSVTTCFIIRLGGTWPWRFRRDVNAVTLGMFDPGHEPEQYNYYNLRHVLDDNVGRAAPYPHANFCKLCYFVGKPTDEVINDPEAQFEHPFNLNIEFVYLAGGGKPNTVPVVIDPDIRHPGGSGE